jgi:hypothetical protein
MKMGTTHHINQQQGSRRISCIFVLTSQFNERSLYHQISVRSSINIAEDSVMANFGDKQSNQFTVYLTLGVAVELRKSIGIWIYTFASDRIFIGYF